MTIVLAVSMIVDVAMILDVSMNLVAVVVVLVSVCFVLFHLFDVVVV